MNERDPTPIRPAATGMEAFDAFLQDGWALCAGPGPAPLVLQLCDFAPEELIRAVGARSVRLFSGCHQSAERASAEVPLDMCGAARAAVGELRRLLDGGVRPELVIVAATCDAQRRLAQWLAARTEVFVLEPPFVRDDAGLDRWVWQIERLTQRLGRIAPLRRAGLRRAIEERNRRVWLSRQLRDLQRREAPPLHGLEAIRVFQAGQRMDPDLWRKEVEALLQARAGGGARPPGRARLLLAGSPSAWPDLKVPELIAQSGADLVADMTCAGGHPLSHPTVVDEDTLGGMVRAAAERTLLTCLCPIFSSLDERKDRLARLVEDFRVDGVIHHTLRLCLPSDGEIAALSAWCRERNLPFLSLRSDLGPEESGGLRNRLEAFLELIHSGRGA